MDERLELHEIYILLKKRAGMILLITIAMALIAAILSYYVMTPVYQSSTQLVVNQETGAEEEEELVLTESDVMADLQLVNTYRELIESPLIMKQVIERLGLELTAQELAQQFTVITTAESKVINVIVEAESEERAADIANTAVIIFQEEIQDILDVNNVKVWYPAEGSVDGEPVSPNPLFNIAVGAGLGLILGMGLAFLLSYLNRSLKNERDVEKHLGIPVLAVIPSVKRNRKDQG